MNHTTFNKINIIRDFTEAWRLFIRKKIHSLISSIGVIIGVSSVVILISVSQGAREKALQSIQGLGLNTINIQYTPPTDISNQYQNLSPGIDFKDVEAIKKRLSNDTDYSAFTIRENSPVLYRGKDFSLDLIGTDDAFIAIEKLQIIKGRPLLKHDLESRNRVGIISSDIARQYNISPGAEIISNGSLLRIIGIAKSSEKRNRFILYPISTDPEYSPRMTFSGIILNVHEVDRIEYVLDQTTQILKKNHQGIQNYQIVVPYLIIQKHQETNMMFSLVTAIIAFMSLISGGVSITNVLLSNIFEQTREIGLRLAVGAPPGRIIQLYLFNATIVSVIGGGIGVVVSLLILSLIGLFTSLMIIFSFQAFFIGLMLAIITGIAAGIYPAIRASKIAPMQALREYN